MTTTRKKPPLLWAIICFCLPIACILYGTVWVGIRPPILPLITAVAVAAILCRLAGSRWEDMQDGMFTALGRIQIAVAILVMVGMIISAWLMSGTIPGIIYWGLKLIAPKYFLLSTLFLASVASMATGSSFGTMGTLGVALLGIGTALGYPPAMTVGAIVSGAYLGDKMSPVSDSTNITASVCEVPLFPHITSMLWTTLPAFIVSAILYTIIGGTSGNTAGAMESLLPIFKGLESAYDISWYVFIPPLIMIVMAYLRSPVLPTMFACLVSALIIAGLQGVSLVAMANAMTTGYKAATGLAALDALLSRGGIMSIMSTVLLLCSGVALGGILERAGVLTVLLDTILHDARSPFRLVLSTLVASYIILLGTGSQMLAVIVPGRAFSKPFADANISARVLSRTCEDAGTIGCPLIPWSVHAFYIMGILNVSAFEFAPYAFLNWTVPIFSLLCAITGLGIWQVDGTAYGVKKV